MDKKFSYEEIKRMEYGYTHAGVFHADDVFSAALLKLINPDIRIIRTFDPPKDRNAIVFDIGGGRYDHHGEQEYRISQFNPTLKIPYAAFGKLWRDLGFDVCEGYEEAFMAVDRDLVSEIDWTDCLGCNAHYNTLSISISAMNPTYEEVNKEGNLGRNRRFDDAVVIAKAILMRVIESDVSKARCRDTLKSIVPEDNLLILDNYIPWKDYAVKENKEYGNHIYFAIYPSLRGGYNIETVPSGNNDGSVLVNLPIKWWGKPENELPKGITFCHATGFLAAAVDKDTAIRYVKKIIDSTRSISRCG